MTVKLLLNVCYGRPCNVNVKQFIFPRLHVGGMGIWMNRVTEELNFSCHPKFSFTR